MRPTLVDRDPNDFMVVRIIYRGLLNFKNIPSHMIPKLASALTHLVMCKMERHYTLDPDNASDFFKHLDLELVTVKNESTTSDMKESMDWIDRHHITKQTDEFPDEFEQVLDLLDYITEELNRYCPTPPRTRIFMTELVLILNILYGQEMTFEHVCNLIVHGKDKPKLARASEEA